MQLSRRGFLQSVGAAFAAGMAMEVAQASPALAVDKTNEWKLVNTEESTNICCYCSGGCGSLLSVRDGELINLEGDPDHPINQGGLCAKGATMFQLRNVIDEETREVIPNPNRVTHPMVRRPGTSEWEEISWDDAVDEIARHVKTTRDENFIEEEDGLTVNRCNAIASFGGSQQNSEEEYLILKMMRSLGVLYIDNQARVCHSSTVAGLAPSFGRGSMTGHYCDYQNADVILTCGSNNVENHPVSSKWVQKAMDRGATWIVVDPRYTRSAACADIYCPIRCGTDIAFYGGLLNYIMENDLIQEEYVVNYTNAPYLLDPDFDFDVETGLFSGWNEETGAYDTTTWGYQTDYTTEWDTSETGSYSWVNAEGVPVFTPPTHKVPKKDYTLQDPNCVYQRFKEHYSRYTIEMVSNICGMDAELLEKVYSIYAATGAPEKTGTILYALGQTQHHYGAQNCRAMTLVQLLLGNAGMAGGGVNAMRGEPNVQGATDMAMLAYDFPGYLKWPNVEKYPSLRKWLENETYSDGYYTNKPKFFVSALKEWYGDNATVDNDYCYDLLPKIPTGKDYTTISSFEAMRDGEIKGYFCWGMSPATSAANVNVALEGMSNLDWLVVADWVETETACFWKEPTLDASTIDTEVYLLPAALIYEKSGTILNSGRWMQWRYKACDPWEDVLPDYEMCDRLWKRIVELYEDEGGVCPEAITKVKWDYYVDGVMDPRAVAWAFNGYRNQTTDFKAEEVDLLTNFTELKADGSTSCAIWIYSGYYNNSEAVLDPAQQPTGYRSNDDPSGLGLYPQWSFAWPMNRRILYNRASCDMEGKPWNADRTLVEWTGSEWITYDVPDFAYKSTAADGTVTWIEPNDRAFMMTWEQNARLICSNMKDMPCPEHYEPFESPTENALNGRQNSPCIRFATDKSVQQGTKEDYPICVTTYSVVEHWQTGGQTRSCPALVEAMPAQFIEISEELAEERGIENGERIRIFNNRGSVEAYAFVTCRFKPMTINGESVHTAGMIHHWGWAGAFSTDDAINKLSPNVGDPNSFIPEYKAFLIDIEKL